MIICMLLLVSRCGRVLVRCSCWCYLWKFICSFWVNSCVRVCELVLICRF